MIKGIVSNLKRVMRDEVFAEFMQNLSVVAPLDEMRSLGLKDEEIKALRSEHYKGNRNAAKVQGFFWPDDDEDDDETNWEFEDKDGDVRIFLQGPIDSWWGIDCQDIVRKLRGVKKIKSIHIDIESPGGFVSEGLALYHELKAQQRKNVPITTETRGLVASMAMSLFVVGNRRIATQHSMMMIHAPWRYALLVGNKWDMEKGYKEVMEGFDLFTSNSINIYADNIDDLDYDTVEGWFMEGDKWMDENVAMELGFATEVADVPESDDGDGGDDGDDEGNDEDGTGDDGGNESAQDGDDGAQATQQQDGDEATGQRETPADDETQTAEEVQMNLSKEREAKIRQALNLDDGVEITEDHVEQYLAKQEQEQADQEMQREMADTARMKKEVENQLKPFYDKGNMSKAQFDKWTATIMRSDDPQAQLKNVVEQLSDQFGDPAESAAANQAAQQAQQQQQAAVDSDPGAGDPPPEEKTKVEKALELYKKVCDDNGNTVAAFKMAYQTIKEHPEYGMPVLRELQTLNKISAQKTDAEGNKEFKTDKEFRQEIVGASTFKNMIGKKEKLVGGGSRGV